MYKPLPTAAAAVLIAGVAAVITWLVMDARATDLQSGLEDEVVALEDQLSLLFRGVYSSGGGVNLKMMPDPETGEATVPLEEVFSFDRSHAFCRVDNNPQAFTMATYQMGDVKIEANQFFMSMVATTIEEYTVSTDPDGTRRVTMSGGLDCSTEVGQATVTIGSRTAAEHATYFIEAIDGGTGGGEAGDSFAFTVFFDPDEAPVNYAIFGPEFTFTGRMTSGEISIIDPREG